MTPGDTENPTGTCTVTRKERQRLQIGDITIQVSKIVGRKVVLTVRAPKSMKISRIDSPDE